METKPEDTTKESPIFQKWQTLALLVIIVIGSTLFFSKRSQLFFKEKSEKAFQPLDSIYKLDRSILEENSVLTTSQTKLLLAKTAVIQQNKAHHKLIFMQLYSNHYAAVTLFPYLTAITVILSFLIAQRGWSQCKPLLKTLFLAFATLSSLYGLYPTIYKQIETSEQNIEGYLGYNKIQKQVFHYGLTAKSIYSDTLDFKQFLNKINEAEYNADNIYFGLEQRSIDKKFIEGIGK